MTDWTLLKDDGSEGINFTSLIEIDVRSAGEVCAFPVEEGSFASYNKVEEALSINIVLARSGDKEDQEETLKQLTEFKESTDLLALSMPTAFYDNLSLESFNYSKSYGQGVNYLIAELELKEIREVETASYTIASSKNPTSVSQSDLGKKETSDKQKSILDLAWGKVKDVLDANKDANKSADSDLGAKA